MPAPEQPHDTFAKLEAFTKLNTGAVDRKKKPVTWKTWMVFMGLGNMIVMDIVEF